VRRSALLVGMAVVVAVMGGVDALVLASAGAAPSRTTAIALAVADVAVLGVAGLLVAGVATRANAAARGAQAALMKATKESEQLWQVLDNTLVVIYMRDSEGRYILVNREYELLFDVRREDIVGLTDSELEVFPKETAEKFRANDLKALKRGVPIQVEEVAPHPDGPHTYITVKHPITDTDGRPYAVCGISTDITDLKRAEQQVSTLITELETRVRERTAELEATTRELDAFAYSVSHDLRAPLRTIGSFSEILLEDHAAQLDATGLDYLGRVRAATDRMSDLIDALLNLSHAVRTELVRRPVNLADLARDILADLRGADPDRDVEVVIEDLPAAGDKRLLTVVLQNLLSNAWKFTAGRAPARIHVGSIGTDDSRTYFVADNGAGFDTRYAAKLFLPFQRLHSHEEFPGTGIGLAIVARIIARHGGRAWAQSTPGEGATFYFTLTPEDVDPPAPEDPDPLAPEDT
jgi:PAS domain S-box-containing protein